MRRDNRKKILQILIVFFAVVLIVAGGYLGKYYYDMSKDQKAFAKLTHVQGGVDKSEYSYEMLKKANEDFAGWLYIEGTNIDYPVMYTPNEPEYYLRRSFEKKYSRSGVPFIDGACTTKSNNLVIHGHNMRNGTMFSELLKYADKDFFYNHQLISFQDMDGENIYQVIAAFYTQVYSEDKEGVFRYYKYFGDLDKAKLEEYLRNVRQASLFAAECEFDADDSFMTLSTCAYQTDDGRFVVVAKKAENKSASEG